MVTIKHKVTIKTKTAQEELHTTVESHEVVIKTKQSEQNLEPKKVSVIPKSEKPSNTGKILYGIIAIITIIMGIYFFGIMDNVGNANVGAVPERIAQTGETTKSGKYKTIDETNADDESVTANVECTKPSEVNEIPAEAEKENVSSTVGKKKTDSPSVNETPSTKPLLTKQTITTTAKRTSTPINDDVEENARRVIRGDFGNGQTRKDKLGSSYSEIQGRVNEMYRQRLVH